MQVADGTQLIRLVDNTELRLTIEQAAANSLIRFPLHVVALLSALFLVYCLLTRRWTWTGGPIILLVLALVTLRPMPSYRMMVDTPSRQVSWGTVQNGQPVMATSMPLAHLSAAGLQSGKSGSRIVLVLKDGSEQFPLGTSYYMNEPLQLVMTQRIQQLLGNGQGQ